MEYLRFVVVSIIGAWFLADLGTGAFHWLEDQYLSEEKTKMPFLKKIGAKNDLHHTNPGTIGNVTLWENTKTSGMISIPMFGICYATTAPLVMWLTILFGVFANALHSFSHKPKNRIPTWIKWMQGTGLFQDPRHHGKHHYKERTLIMKEDTTFKYCVMTNYMNPILDGIKFFPTLERIISLFGLRSHRIQKLDRLKTA